MEDTLVVFTSQTIAQMIQGGGSQDWVVDPERVRRCSYIVCTSNRIGERADRSERYEHRAAFLVAPIVSVEPSRDPVEAGRYIIRFDRFALINVPEIWPKKQNPVMYSTMADIGIDVDILIFDQPNIHAATEPERSSVNERNQQIASHELIDDKKRIRENSALLIARLALSNQPKLHPAHFNELLSLACWKFTEAGGSKYQTRYITRAAMKSEGTKQHEHVIPRLTLRIAMLQNPEMAEDILRVAIACTVTPEEHRRLDAKAFGWHRYHGLGIEVIDTQTGMAADLDVLAQELDAMWISLTPNIGPSSLEVETKTTSP